MRRNHSGNPHSRANCNAMNSPTRIAILAGNPHSRANCNLAVRMRMCEHRTGNPHSRANCNKCIKFTYSKHTLAIHTHARIATGLIISQIIRDTTGNPHSRANCDRETVLQYRIFDCAEAPVLRSFFVPDRKSAPKHY